MRRDALPDLRLDRRVLVQQREVAVGCPGAHDLDRVLLLQLAECPYDVTVKLFVVYCPEFFVALNPLFGEPLKMLLAELLMR